MSKPLPIWQDLPTHFKEDVVNYLDFKSRLKLRSCSKSDLHLVDNCPFHIHSLQIDQECDEPLYIFLTFVKDGTRYKFDSTEHNSTALFNLLSHRNSKCSFLVFACHLEFTLDKFIKEFLGKLENRQQKLNIENFAWYCGETDVLIPLFEWLKPNGLNKIRLNLMDFEDENKESTVREFVHTDQFKNGREIDLYDYPVDDYFQIFLGFDNLRIGVEKLTEKMLLELIDAVKTRNPPIGSQFVIKSKKVIEIDTLEPAFQDLEGVDTRFKEDQPPQKAVHLISDSRCLVIIKWNKAIEATVCGWENWKDDFQKYHGKNLTWIDLI
ncbi:unnamed protein product [Caenorhabditis brenneri]